MLEFPIIISMIEEVIQAWFLKSKIKVISESLNTMYNSLFCFNRHICVLHNKIYFEQKKNRQKLEKLLGLNLYKNTKINLKSIKSFYITTHCMVQKLIDHFTHFCETKTKQY